MLRRSISALLGVDGVGRRLGAAGLLLEADRVLCGARALALGTPLLGAGRLLIAAALRLRAGLLALLGHGPRLVGLHAVALDPLLALLGGDLVAQPAALLLVGPLAGLHVGLGL